VEIAVGALRCCHANADAEAAARGSSACLAGRAATQGVHRPADLVKNSRTFRAS